MTKKQIQKHEEEYIHIKKSSFLPLLGTILFSLLAYLNLKLINWETIKYTFTCEECSDLVVSDLINIYPILGEYVLISLIAISITAIIKGGYNKLKSFEEEGLIFGLIFGLIGGLISGLILGLIGVLILGLIFGLIGGLIIGLIIGLIFGLIGGLISGLIIGLRVEFN